jgi:hypothetical protein
MTDNKEVLLESQIAQDTHCPFAHSNRTFGINDKRISVSGLTKFAISIK